MTDYGVERDQWFWGSVLKTESCWVWTGVRNAAGYGIARYRELMGLAHRVSYQMHKGEIPLGMVVCHACDIPWCVNPDHLWAGTQTENMEDMVRKGRASWQRPDGSFTSGTPTPPYVRPRDKAEIAAHEVLTEHGPLAVGRLLAVLAGRGFRERTAQTAIHNARKAGAIVVDSKAGNTVILRANGSVEHDA